MKLNDRDFDDLEIEDLETVRKRVEGRKRKKGKRGRRGGTNLPPALIPVLIALLLIVILIIGGLAGGIFKGIGNVKVDADISGFFGEMGEGEAGIILNDSYLEDARALLDDGEVYLPLDFVMAELNDWFYRDEDEGVLLYTTPEGTDSLGESDGVKDIRGTLCMSAALVTKYTNLDYSDHSGEKIPYVVIRNKWEDGSEASVINKTGLYLDSGKKSGVFEVLEKDDKVRILSAGNEWTLVADENNLMGYVNNKFLGEYSDFRAQPPENVAEMVFPSTSFNEKVILGWHQIMNRDANALAGDVISKDSAINVLSPTWYALNDTEGGMLDKSSASYVEAAHAVGKKVWPAIDNFNVEGFDIDDDTHEVLKSTSKRKKVIDTLVTSVRESGADGINVDFENLSGQTGVHFAQFIKELSVACHGNALILSVDNYVPTEYSGNYHREVQGKVCDFCIIMGYDEYTSGSSEAGPVASLSFVEDGIDRTLEQVDASKVINGLPFFTRLWETQNGAVKSSKALGMAEAKDVFKSRGITPEWADSAGCNYGEYEEGGSLYRMWLEDESSLSAKLSVMETRGLAGAAFWKLGLEDDTVWDEISAYALSQPILPSPDREAAQ